MATYGNSAGVQINTSSGSIAGVTIGREQYLFLIGVGNADTSIATNEPYNPNSRTDADDKFGAGSDLARAYNRALDNGANPDYVYGIQTSLSSESKTTTTGELTNTPIVPDKSRITATGTTDSNEFDVYFDYQSTIDSPTGSEEVIVNPNDGQVDATAEVTIETKYADWSSAIDSVSNELIEGEFAVINPLTNAPSVGDTLTSAMAEMRKDIKMVVGALGADPNDIAVTASEADGDDSLTIDDTPEFDTSAYTNPYDDDTLFAFAPTAADDLDDQHAEYGVEALSAVAVLMAGTNTDDPIYDDEIVSVGDFAQRISRADVQNLRAAYTIPVRQAGSRRIESNVSTYDQEENGGWTRDYFRRRIVDLSIATLYQVARNQMGSVLDSETIEDVQDSLDNQVAEFVEDGLLQPGSNTVNVFRKDSKTIGIDASVTPYGVAKEADVELEVFA